MDKLIFAELILDFFYDCIDDDLSEISMMDIMLHLGAERKVAKMYENEFLNLNCIDRSSGRMYDYILDVFKTPVSA